MNTPVIKMSEMMLQAAGQYVGEIGNPSYKPLSELLLFESKSGALLNTRGRPPIELPAGALVAIPQHLGHVTLAEFCSAAAGTDGWAVMSEHDFQDRLAELFQRARPKMDLLCRIAGVLGGRLTEFCMEDASIRQAACQDPHYSPRLLLETAAELATRESGVPLQEPLCRIGFFDLSRGDIGTQAISLFYHFNQYYTGHDAAPESKCDAQHCASCEAQRASLLAYPWRTRVIEEYLRAPDGRFGDVLLSVCSELCKCRDPSADRPLAPRALKNRCREF